MPLLAGLLGSAFTKLVEFLAGYATRKVAIGLALTGLMIAGWVALQLALRAGWEALAFVLPASLEVPLGVAFYVLPTNTDDCLTALVVGRMAVWVWDTQRDHAKAIAAIN